MAPLLELEDLRVSFDTYAGEVQAVRGVSLTLAEGETLGIVGESGSGKSVTAQALLRLLPTPPARYKSGVIRFADKANLLTLSEKGMQRVRGHDIAMIFQDPMTSLNPTMRVGNQIIEGIMRHQKASRSTAMKRAVELLDRVGIPEPDRRVRQFPHEFSGGMRQRAMIAIALACKPRLLIADEPTTALDVTIQAQILELLKDLQQETGTAIIMITHDLGIVAGIANRVAVMYGGQIAEMGDVRDIFYKTSHPYTAGLLQSSPRLEQAKGQPLLAIQGTPPDLLHPPVGCAFAARCDYAMRVCHEHAPKAFALGASHAASCWLRHPDHPSVPLRKEVD